MSTAPEKETKPAGEQVPAVKPEAKGIILTEKAAAQIKQIMDNQGSDATKTYLYVGVKGGGCSGLQYLLDLRNEENAPIGAGDEQSESHGIRIVCDLKSYIVGNLSGTTIDFKDGLMGTGFTFDNPNAKRTCGCGSSYTA